MRCLTHSNHPKTIRESSQLFDEEGVNDVLQLRAASGVPSQRSMGGLLSWASEVAWVHQMAVAQKEQEQKNTTFVSVFSIQCFGLSFYALYKSNHESLLPDQTPCLPCERGILHSLGCFCMSDDHRNGLDSSIDPAKLLSFASVWTFGSFNVSCPKH